MSTQSLIEKEKVKTKRTSFQDLHFDEYKPLSTDHCLVNFKRNSTRKNPILSNLLLLKSSSDVRKFKMAFQRYLAKDIGSGNSRNEIKT